METQPLVSVLIPSYNSAHFLDETIKSVLDQTFSNFELIIVDDQSTDNTDEVVQKYLNDGRVTYYKNEINLGLSGNFNKCLSYANGEYIKFLMCDDKFHPQLLEKFVPIMQQYSNVSLVTSYREEFGLSNYLWKAPYQNLVDGKKAIYDSLQDCNWFGEPTTVMFRKSNLFIGGFNQQYNALVDWDMWLRQLTLGDCYVIPEVLSYFRIHANQASQLALKNFTLTIEYYNFYKAIKISNNYQVDFSKIDIEQLIKFWATYCSKVIIKALSSFQLKKNWPLIIKATKIIISEKVVLKSIFKVNRKILRNSLRKFRRSTNNLLTPS
jgi:glycosyltransferase involved in cell wall biosynthesis